MLARHAVLPTPSVSLRVIQPLSCAQIMREAPLIPFFVFKSLRTLPSSVSRKSFPCHSYENCRVRTNNSQSGTPRARGTRPCRNPSILHFRLCELCVLRRLCVNSGLSSLATVHGSLSPFFSDSCGLFCTHQNHNSFVFNRFQTLCPKHPGWGIHTCGSCLSLAGACEPAGASLFQRFLFQLSTVDCQPPPCRSSHVSHLCYSGRPRMRDNPSWRLRNATRKRKPTP